MVAQSRDGLRTSWEGTLENQKGNSFHRMSFTKASCYTWISRHHVCVYVCVCVCVCVSTCMLARTLRHVQLFATPWTIARQAAVHWQADSLLLSHLESPSEHPNCYQRPPCVPHGLPSTSGEPHVLLFCLASARHHIGSGKGNPEPEGSMSCASWGGILKFHQGRPSGFVSDARLDDQADCQRRSEDTLA